MSHRKSRFLLCWFFVSLQALAPFIHAHAGSVHLNHVGFLHLHQELAHDGVSGHVLATDEHGTEVAVAAGMRPRSDSAVMPAESAWLAVSGQTCPIPAARHPGAGMPAPLSPSPSPPSHTHPFALAPPAV